MAYEQIRMDRSLSRLELALAAILIALLIAWALNRLAVLAAVAEATSLELTIHSLRTGVMGAVAVQYIKGDLDGIRGLAESNPVGPLLGPPSGYIGAIRGANPEQIQPGQWYYDEDNRWLVYHVVNADYVDYRGEGPVRVRVQLQVNYNAVAEDAGQRDPRPSGISVTILDELNWKY